MPKKKTHTIRRVLLALTLAAVCAAGVVGWRWMTGVVCTRVEITGARHADRAALLDLARVDTGLVLFDVDPRLVADRLRRHPWVARASVRRLPTGTLAIDVEERVPVALVVDAGGRPAQYLDRFGYPMPLAPGAAYDVPLLHGLTEATHPVRPVEDETVRALLDALAEAGAGTDALISDVEVRRAGEAWLHTVPADDRGAFAVRLGRAPYGEKLARLEAFWHQAVLTQPEKTFAQIDLRFDSQIVTREEERRDR